jgi:effector-binding domain-containing protein
MVSCRCDARPGGTFRYEWSHDTRGSFHITGEFLALDPHKRIVHVERMFLPVQTPDNHIETIFEPRGRGTLMTMTMTLPDATARAEMLKTGMEHGMEASYARFEAEVAGTIGEGPYSIVTLDRQVTASVIFEAAFADLPNAERTGRARIAEALKTLDVTPGLTTTLCRMLDTGRMHYEPGVIVDRAFDAAGDVICSELPAGRAVAFTLVGPFDQLPQAWPALFSWCAEKHLKREGTFWQIYGPHANNPAEQVTTLYALLAS